MAKILLAEDDKSMMDFLVIALERAGHEVTPKNDGIEALKSINEGNKFDLLLTDIVMPGIDGIELAKKATEKSPNIKTMFITGFSAMAAKQKEESPAKNSKLLPKPFHLNDLIKQVENLLEQ